MKVTVFPVVTYSCDSWTIKKADHQRIDAFDLWCWRRLLRVPWMARWTTQSILGEMNPEYSLEGLKLKLKLQHFGHLMRTAETLEKSLMLGKTEGRRRRRCQRTGWLHGITDTMDMNLGKLRKMVRGRETWRAAVHVVMSQTQLGNWTTILYARLNTIFSSPNYIMRYLLLVFPFLKCLFWRQKEMEYLAQGYTGRGGTKLWIQ